MMDNIYIVQPLLMKPDVKILRINSPAYERNIFILTSHFQDKVAFVKIQQSVFFHFSEFQ